MVAVEMIQNVPVDPAGDPVLTRFRAALNELYEDRIDRIILYGSRARGDIHASSDYDVAVFLKSLPKYWQEI